ncbi:MAG: DsrE family protein [Gemmatimonadota bacterium]|nr:DsrE family protein [Gemmatimonadota bacterium]
MSNTLLILNDPPYGTERSYNGLRLAGSLGVREDETVRVFLMGDAALCAKSGQKVPNGFYNIQTMVKLVLNNDGEVGVCGSCMDARGLGDQELIEGCNRSSMNGLTDWVQWADRTLVF